MQWHSYSFKENEREEKQTSERERENGMRSTCSDFRTQYADQEVELRQIVATENTSESFVLRGFAGEAKMDENVNFVPAIDIV